MRPWFLPLALFSVALRGSATQAAEELVKATVLADTSAIVNGHPFTVGVLLHVAPGWHIYWKSPGDAGLPTKVDFTLPPGYTAEAVQYPAPERFEAPGNIVTYGYADSVLLLAKIAPPANGAEAKDPVLLAKVSWLVCSNVCLPGKASVTLSLPVAKDAKPANQELFTAWKQRLPIDATAAQSPATCSVTGSLAADAPATFTVKLHWKDAKTAPRSVDFCPESDPALQLSDVKITTTGQETAITFKASVLKGLSLGTHELGALVTYAGPDGHPVAISVAIPLGVSPLGTSH